MSYFSNAEAYQNYLTYKAYKKYKHKYKELTTFQTGGDVKVPLFDKSIERVGIKQYYKEWASKMAPTLANEKAGVAIDFTNLKTRTYSDGSTKGPKKFNQTVNLISQGIPNLTTINLSGCDKITDEGITKLAKNSANLTTNNLSSSDTITD
jgi:hypothetical protein